MSDENAWERFTNVRIGGTAGNGIIISVSKCRNLVELTVSNGWCLYGACTPHFDDISKLEHLYLDGAIADYRNLSAKGICRIFQVGNFPNLRHLSLISYKNLDDRCLDSIANW